MTEPTWLAAARKDLGLKEIVGSKDEARVVAFFAAAGHPYVKDDETAWCAAFINAKLAQVGVKGTGLLNARSFLDWGAPLVRPIPGAVTVFRRGSSAWQGHVTLFVRAEGSTIVGLGGNQSNRVSEAAYGKAALLGYRWPADVPIPAEGDAQSIPLRPGRTPIEIGSTGALVAEWQRGLRLLGYGPGLAVDGAYGPKSRAATLAFQRHRMLAVDGVVDGADWTSLDTALAQLG